MAGKILAVCVSKKKGTQKKNVGSAVIKANHGIVGDAHSGPWHRQVSLLSDESIEKMRAKGLPLGFGDFGENIVTWGVDLTARGVGTTIKLGDSVIGEVSQIGKVCHNRCTIYFKAGDCIMPREGIFLKILTGGKITVGDKIEILHNVPSGD